MSDSLEVNIHVRRGTFEASLNHRFTAGRVTAIIGPNGAGKSTLLGAIGGLIPSVTGTILRGDKALTDSSARRPINVPPHLRSTALLLQTGALFPFMTVRDNIAFGPKAQGLGEKEAKRRATTAADLLDVTPLLDARASRLSGGQTQRVALARAIAAHPKTLMLDEPTSALDIEAARTFRTALLKAVAPKEGSGGITTIVVTHSVVDVLALADELVVIEHGSAVETGSAREVLLYPSSRFIARFAGRNRVAANVVSPPVNNVVAAVTADGSIPFRASWHPRQEAPEVGQAIWLSTSPTDVRLHRPTQTREPRTNLNVWEDQVEHVHASGSGFDYQLHRAVGMDASMPLSSTDGPARGPGQKVAVSVPVEALLAYRAQPAVQVAR